jgi:hypothetical protein
VPAMYNVLSTIAKSQVSVKCRQTQLLKVKNVKGRLAGSFGTATFRVDCTLPLK